MSANIYTVKVEIGKSVEVVSVDSEKGPLVKQADGKWTHMEWRQNLFQSPVGHADRKVYQKSWMELGKSEQEVALNIVARKNKALRELLDSPGYKPPALPDFLAYLHEQKPLWQTMSQDQQSVWWASMSRPPVPEFRQDEQDQPVLVCWYSGGLDATQGREQMSPLLDAAGKAGLKHRLVLDYPDTYGIEGEGSKHWARYVDRLIEEIDSEPDRKGRKLILFGHSRGATPAMTLATRLDRRRVLKVYAVSSGAPIAGQDSPFKKLSEAFKASTDVDLLRWFCGLNPVPVLIRMMQSVEKGDMKIEDSAYLKEKVDLMKRQYVNAIWPDMTKDFKVIDIPILAVGGKQDPNESPESMDRWRQWSSREVAVKWIEAGHMDAVNHTDLYIGDMVTL